MSQSTNFCYENELGFFKNIYWVLVQLLADSDVTKNCYIRGINTVC